MVKSPTELLLLMEPGKMPIVIRLARHFGQFKLDSQNLGSGRLELRFRTGLGSYHIVVFDHSDGVDYIECRTWFIPSFGFIGMEIYPDVLFIYGATGSVSRQKAVLQQQVQLLSASVLLELEGRTGTAFYHHDLSALSDLAEDTRSSLSGIVKIRWPELGPSFRQENQDPLRRGRKYSIGHFHLIIDHKKCHSARDLSMQMIRSLERVYPRLKLPKLSLENYFRIAKDSLEVPRQLGSRNLPVQWGGIKYDDQQNIYFGYRTVFCIFNCLSATV